MAGRRDRAAGPTLKNVLFGFIAFSSAVKALAVDTSPSFEIRTPTTGQKVLKPKGTQRKLHGRFLQISDLHPDRFYRPGADPENACHHRKVSKGEFDISEDDRPDSSIVGKYGAPRTDCDSPIALINATFAWIHETLKDGVDFVVWTGDSARHDNDVQRPRDNKEVWGLNKLMAEKMMEVFVNKDGLGDDDPDNDTIIPIVPTLGNNDMLPHNIMHPGPSATIRNYLDTWSSFIPSSQYHVFSRGGYFWKEVVPGIPPRGKEPGRGGLAVISLNTMYFFSSNAAVDGCDIEAEAGTLEMKWLRAQLDLMREEGMKAIIIGHVPPAHVKNSDGDGWRKRNWDETCWRKYVLYQRQYRDVIVTSMFGHMNIDHFLIFDTNHAMTTESVEPTVHTAEEKYHVSSAADYLQSLRAAYAKIPKVTDESSSGRKGKPGKGEPEFDKSVGERFVLSFVSPSIIPNYFPSLRVYSYNVTGVELPDEDDPVRGDSELEANKKKKKKDKKKKPTPPPDMPDGPAKGTLGPAYVPQAFSLTSYVQYYANLTKINLKESKFKYEVLYDTAKDCKGYKNLLKSGLLVKNYMRLAKAMVDARKVKLESISADLDEIQDYSDSEEESDSPLYYEFPDETVEIRTFGDDNEKGNKVRTKPKKGRKGGRIPSRDAIWESFLYRAFVGAVDNNELREI